jgi:hypothetical protein
MTNGMTYFNLELINFEYSGKYSVTVVARYKQLPDDGWVWPKHVARRNK